MAANQPEFLPGTLYMLILRILAAGPLHGYAIAKRIHAVSREALSIEEGSLYPALNRMLVKGWLAAEWGTSESNRKPGCNFRRNGQAVAGRATYG